MRFVGDYIQTLWSLKGKKEMKEAEAVTVTQKKDSGQLTQDGSTTCSMTGQGKEQESSLIVPVWLFTKEDPSHKLLVVSLLDD